VKHFHENILEDGEMKNNVRKNNLLNYQNNNSKHREERVVIFLARSEFKRIHEEFIHLINKHRIQLSLGAVRMSAPFAGEGLIGVNSGQDDDTEIVVGQNTSTPTDG
jgi:hypothetical protein